MAKKRRETKDLTEQEKWVEICHMALPEIYSMDALHEIAEGVLWEFIKLRKAPDIPLREKVQSSINEFAKLLNDYAEEQEEKQ